MKIKIFSGSICAPDGRPIVGVRVDFDEILLTGITRDALDDARTFFRLRREIRSLGDLIKADDPRKPLPLAVEFFPDIQKKFGLQNPPR